MGRRYAIESLLQWIRSTRYRLVCQSIQRKPISIKITDLEICAHRYGTFCVLKNTREKTDSQILYPQLNSCDSIARIFRAHTVFCRKEIKYIYLQMKEEEKIWIWAVGGEQKNASRIELLYIHIVYIY